MSESTPTYIIKGSLEELLKSRDGLRTQLQRVDLLIRLLGDELRRCQTPEEVKMDHYRKINNNGDWMA